MGLNEIVRFKGLVNRVTNKAGDYNNMYHVVNFIHVKNIFTILLLGTILISCNSSDNRNSHFVESIVLLQKAFKMEGEISSSGTDSDLKDIVSIYENSLAEAKLVSDSELLKYHKELPYHYRNEFIKGLELYINGYYQKDSNSMNRGTILINSFGEFYKLNL